VKALTDVVQGIIDPNGIPVQTIGYWGGTLAIPGSDFTISFPVGALSKSTNITIVSDASGYVSYDMQPHGLRFNKPVIVTQRLRNTRADEVPSSKKLFGAYFTDENLLSGIVNGLLNAVEIVTSVTINQRDGDPELQTWLLNHFSRYMLASG
jgi:hypothetical protein